MEGFPEYQSHVGVAVPGPEDLTSGDKETPSAGLAVANAVDKIATDKIESVAGALGAEKGRKDGRTFRTLPDISPGADAYNKEGLPIAQAVAANGVASQYQELYEEQRANLTPQSPALLNAGMTTAAQTYAKNMDPKLLPGFERSATLMGQQYVNKINNDAVRLRSAQAQSAVLQNLDASRGNLMLVANQSGLDGLDSAAVQEGINNYSGILNSASTIQTIGPKRTEQLRQGFQYDIFHAAVMGELQKGVNAITDAHIPQTQVQRAAELNAVESTIQKDPRFQKLTPAQQAHIQTSLSVGLKQGLQILGHGLTDQQATAQLIWNNQHGIKTSPQVLAALRPDSKQVADAINTAQLKTNNMSLSDLSAAHLAYNGKKIPEKYAQIINTAPPGRRAEVSNAIQKAVSARLALARTKPVQYARSLVLPSQITQIANAISDPAARQEALSYFANPQKLLTDPLQPGPSQVKSVVQKLYALIPSAMADNGGNTQGMGIMGEDAVKNMKPLFGKDFAQNFALSRNMYNTLGPVLGQRAMNSLVQGKVFEPVMKIVSGQHNSGMDTRIQVDACRNYDDSTSAEKKIKTDAFRKFATKSGSTSVYNKFLELIPRSEQAGYEQFFTAMHDKQLNDTPDELVEKYTAYQSYDNTIFPKQVKIHGVLHPVYPVVTLRQAQEIQDKARDHIDFSPRLASLKQYNPRYSEDQLMAMVHHAYDSASWRINPAGTAMELIGNGRPYLVNGKILQAPLSTVPDDFVTKAQLLETGGWEIGLGGQMW